MKLTKSILVAALVAGGLLAGNASLFAQQADGAAPAPAAGGTRRTMTSETMITRFQTALGETNKLTEAEITQVKPVLDTMIKQQADLRADTTVVQADRATKRAAITKQASDALKPILTPAQFTIIQPMLQRGGRRTTPAPAPAN